MNLNIANSENNEVIHSISKTDGGVCKLDMGSSNAERQSKN